MPELPDVSAYLDALERRIVGQCLERVRISSVSLLRTADVLPAEVEGHVVSAVHRVGKAIAFELEGGFWLVLHLMIAGRLHWRAVGAKLGGRNQLAALDFPNGTLVLTEAGSKRRAWMRILRGPSALEAIDPGGIDVFIADVEAFRHALTRENHTLKRALTDPRIISGVGNAYSDEILHAAKLSPIAQTQRLTDEEWARLLAATQTTLQAWIDRLRDEAHGDFPEHVTAFHDAMAVHGRYGKPCPRCGTPVQRIRYADNETNYCPHCQTRDVVLADRSLSRLLKSDWPRTLEELDELKRR